MEQVRLWYYSQPRAIRKLLLANVVMYLVWNLVLVHFQPTATFVYTRLALNSTLSEVVFQPWQVLTYSFLHLGPGLGGFLHILFNMLWLVWIGREFEQIYGAPRLLSIYVLGSIGGAVVTVGLHALFPGIQSFGGIVNGASASVMAVMTLVAVVQPQKSISLLFIGVVRLQYVVIGFLFLDVLWSSSGGTSISAHWGGAITGFIVGKAFLSGTDLSRWAIPVFEFRSSSRRNARSSSDRDSDSERVGILRRLEGWASGRSDGNIGDDGKKVAGAHSPARGARNANPNIRVQENESEIDTILDKISSSGYESLSDDEKRILFEAGDK